MMRMLDLRCPRCGNITIDYFQRNDREPLPYCRECTEDPLVLCGTLTERVLLPTGRGTVISDECDVVVHHGICNLDGSPRRYRFKSEMRAEAARRGLVNHVEHMPATRGGDSSPYTSKWV